MISFSPEDIGRYMEAHSSQEPEIFKALARETRDKTDQPEMQVGHIEGLFLKILARSVRAERVLEIGTFTGYSSLMLAEGVAADGQVITCDIDPKVTSLAQRFWDQSPHGQRITLELGRALETINKVPAPIDMVFIDADKQNYIAYWEACVPKVRTGGLLVADNVLWSGRVLDPQEPDDHALAAFNEHVRNDSRVECVMLPIRDGITIASKL